MNILAIMCNGDETYHEELDVGTDLQGYVMDVLKEDSELMFRFYKVQEINVPKGAIRMPRGMFNG